MAINSMIEKLLCYLIEHNDAKDTIKGIYKCWLTKKEDLWDEEMVKKSLNLLILRGWVLERDISFPPQKIYSLNKSRLHEMRAFLVESRSRRKDIAISLPYDFQNAYIIAKGSGMECLVKFLKEEEGATAVEYAIIDSLIAAVIAVIVGTLGGKVVTAFTSGSTGWP